MPFHRSYWAPLLPAWVALAATLAAQAQAPAAPPPPPLATPRVTYARSFKSSIPAFIQVEVSRDGAARYQVREKEGDPLFTLDFTASPDTRGAIFAAARDLHDFSHPTLESSQKVAYTGSKMLAYDDSDAHNVQQFTYTRNPTATRLVARFEAISVTAMDTVRLRRAVQYQPLDVLEIMDQIQSDWAGHQMAEPEILAPTLRAVVANGDLMAAARKRAQKLLDEFLKK